MGSLQGEDILGGNSTPKAWLGTALVSSACVPKALCWSWWGRSPELEAGRERVAKDKACLGGGRWEVALRCWGSSAPPYGTVAWPCLP